MNTSKQVQARQGAEQTHTPTPWVVSSDGRSIEAIDKTSNLPLTTICTFPNPAFNRDDVNAAFIVRACNAHDDLVAALRGLVNADGRRLSDQALAILLDDARAALAKAGAA